jgi:arginyl-tRNA synthetase
LLYIVARINSILKKVKAKSYKLKAISVVEPAEKQLLLELTKYEQVLEIAAEEKDPSQIAKYLFNLAQVFNNFYQACPVLQVEGEIKNFRLQLVHKVKEVMSEGLDLLGIETVEEM